MEKRSTADGKKKPPSIVCMYYVPGPTRSYVRTNGTLYYSHTPNVLAVKLSDGQIVKGRAAHALLHGKRKPPVSRMRKLDASNPPGGYRLEIGMYVANTETLGEYEPGFLGGQIIGSGHTTGLWLVKWDHDSQPRTMQASQIEAI